MSITILATRVRGWGREPRRMGVKGRSLSVITMFEGRAFKKIEGRVRSEGIVFDVAFAEDVSNDTSVVSQGASKPCGVT